MSFKHEKIFKQLIIEEMQVRILLSPTYQIGKNVKSIITHPIGKVRGKQALSCLLVGIQSGRAVQGRGSWPWLAQTTHVLLQLSNPTSRNLFWRYISKIQKYIYLCRLFIIILFENIQQKKISMLNSHI